MGSCGCNPIRSNGHVHIQSVTCSSFTEIYVFKHTSEGLKNIYHKC